MTAKEYLKQAEWIELRIQIKRDELERYKRMATSMGFTLSDMPSGTRDVHSTEMILVKIIDLEREIQTELDRLVAIKVNTTEKLSKMKDGNHRLLLELRYIKNERWEHIAWYMRCSLRSVYRHHGLALKEFEKILNS